ncbi:natterin-4-like [Colossoma macropomum]|uniref:natterin-4-like n=1 Tax=Colossoma macropomum TaxID=42526 RepID=UPI001863AC6F|nr:natterin-4-like [Colossoma macropomum]
METQIINPMCNFTPPCRRLNKKAVKTLGKVKAPNKGLIMMLVAGLLFFMLFSLQFSQASPIQTTTRSVQESSALDVSIQASSSGHTREESKQNSANPQQRSSITQRSGLQRPTYKDFPSLKWVRWSGTPPRWAVRVKNECTKRFDYVCAPLTGCNWAAGYYNTGREALCHSPCGGKEQISPTFDVLVNENNAVHLEWQNVTVDPYPLNAVHASAMENAVGKSPHGVGTFHIPSKRFFVPWKGLEVILQEGFEVLVMTGGYSQQIYDVKYHMEGMTIVSKTSVIVTSISVANNGNAILKESVNLSKSVQQHSTWQTSDSDPLSISSSIRASVPFFAATTGLTYEKTFPNMKGNSVTETDTHSLTLEIDVPPRHICRVKMVGEQYKVSIPFTAKQVRVYDNGDERRTVITGVYHGTQVGEIKAVAESCVLIDGEHHL